MTGQQSLFKDLLAGGFGGSCLVGSGFPFDTIKVRLQTMSSGSSPAYLNATDCARKILKNEGFLGFYKGMAAPLVGVAPIYALCFFGYNVGLRLQLGSHFTQKPTYANYLYAGLLSGAFTVVLMAPGERIKCLLQVQSSSKIKLYDGPIDCAKKLFREGGLRSIYKGSLLTLFRDVPASGAYFLTYNLIKDNLTTDNGTSPLKTLFAGGMAGVLNWAVSMPQDMVKSRFQTAAVNSYPNGLRDVVAEIMRESGPVGFYKGFSPVIVRAFFANGACFMGYETAISMLNKAF